ncbi:MAG: hypothetical protein ACR2PY_00560, partial [Salinispira sp.]
MSVPIRIDDSSNIFHRFAHGDKDKTAICTGIQASGHGMQRFSADFTGSILLFSLNDDHSSVVMRRIPVDRLFSQHKRLYIVIDEYFQGKSMQEYLNDAHSDSPRREFSEFSYMMGMIINTYSHLLPLPINPQHILHSSGKLLILPEKWSHIITSYESEQSRQKGLARINYPDQHGFDKKKLQTFCFACSLYYMLSQHWSIEEDDNSIHDRLKRMKVHRPIEALLPEIPEELAAWFHEALRLKISDCSVPIFYLKKPQSLQSADRSPENTDRRIRSWQRSLKREKLRNTIRRHILPISIAAAVLIIFLASMAAIIRQATSDLLITGLAPEEVIRTFYESYNNLDHTFMADAT